MRNPLKDRKRFRTSSRALLPLSSSDEANSNLSGSNALSRAAKSDYLDLSG